MIFLLQRMVKFDKKVDKEYDAMELTAKMVSFQYYVGFMIY